MNSADVAIFALNAGQDFGKQVCAHLNTALSAHEEREFEDGEHKTRPLVSVRGKDVFVIQSLLGTLSNPSTTSCAECCSFSAL